MFTVLCVIYFEAWFQSSYSWKVISGSGSSLRYDFRAPDYGNPTQNQNIKQRQCFSWHRRELVHQNLQWQDFVLTVKSGRQVLFFCVLFNKHWGKSFKMNGFHNIKCVDNITDAPTTLFIANGTYQLQHGGQSKTPPVEKLNNPVLLWASLV